MARIEVYPERVVMKLTAAERALALRRRDVVLNREAVTSALITDDPWIWLGGVRAPGAHLPGKLAIGTWRGHGGKTFALARAGKPAIVLDFDVPAEGTEDEGWVTEFDPFSRVIISTEHAADLIRALRLDDEDAGENTVFTTHG